MLDMICIVLFNPIALPITILFSLGLLSAVVGVLEPLFLSILSEFTNVAR